jgi:FMN phosphatase YigB (HAD superfamily)
MQKKAIVDIDNTLWHFCDALYENLIVLNGSFPHPDKWEHWDFWERYCSEEIFYEAVESIHFNQDNESYLPYPEAENFLSTLKEHGYHVTIASHRSPVFRSQTEKWLAKHNLCYDELHLSFEKTRLFDSSTTLVVDDAPQILEKAVAQGALAAGLLFPWNRSCTDRGFALFNSLDEVLVHIRDTD